MQRYDIVLVGIVVLGVLAITMRLISARRTRFNAEPWRFLPWAHEHLPPPNSNVTPLTKRSSTLLHNLREDESAWIWADGVRSYKGTYWVKHHCNAYHSGDSSHPVRVTFKHNQVILDLCNTEIQPMTSDCRWKDPAAKWCYATIAEETPLTPVSA